MNSKLGWLLVAVAFAAGGWSYGWQGLVMAFSVTVFWLLLQFGRALRVMKNATEKPVGHVASAVMFQAKLLRHMTMLQVVGLTQSLGQKMGPRAASDASAISAISATGNTSEANHDEASVNDQSDSGNDVWRWTDPAGDSVVLTFTQGKLTMWSLQRARVVEVMDVGSQGERASATL